MPRWRSTAPRSAPPSYCATACPTTSPATPHPTSSHPGPTAVRPRRTPAHRTCRGLVGRRWCPLATCRRCGCPPASVPPCRHCCIEADGVAQASLSDGVLPYIEALRTVSFVPGTNPTERTGEASSSEPRPAPAWCRTATEAGRRTSQIRLRDRGGTNRPVMGLARRAEDAYWSGGVWPHPRCLGGGACPASSATGLGRPDPTRRRPGHTTSGTPTGSRSFGVRGPVDAGRSTARSRPTSKELARRLAARATALTAEAFRAVQTRQDRPRPSGHRQGHPGGKHADVAPHRDHRLG